jgi:hypothetical protein
MKIFYTVNPFFSHVTLMHHWMHLTGGPLLPVFIWFKLSKSFFLL